MPAITFILDSPLHISLAMFFLAKEGQSYMKYNADGVCISSLFLSKITDITDV